MQAAAQNPLIGKAYGIIKTLSYDEEARLLAHSREKALRDAWNREEGARAEGRAEGEAKGRAEGLLSVVLNMLDGKFPFAQISKATGYSESEIERIAREKGFSAV